MQDAECAQMEKLLQALQEQRAELNVGLEISKKNRDDLSITLKEAEIHEEERGDDLKLLIDENADLQKDLDRGKDKCVEDKRTIERTTAELQAMNDTLAQADRPAGNSNSTLADIKIKFGPSSMVS
jgi:ribosome-associated translation inhibitor RaiA